VVEAVHERTNGIPLHIEELLAALDDAALADGGKIRDARVPDTIGDAVLARVSHLSDDARRVVQAGAVVGRCFSPDVLAGILDRPLTELEPTLEELVDAAILYPFDYIDQGYYDFRHQLLRDAIYSAVPPSQLRRFHAQAAEFVMALESSSIVHASRHYERAGLRPQAFRASLAAAEEASRISARQEAYELYQRAIANMPADLAIHERARIYEQLAGAAAAIERNRECWEAATRARELYLEADRPVEAASLLLDMANMLGRDGEPHAESVAYVDRALAEIERAPGSPERESVRLWAQIIRANDQLLASELDAARELAVQTREMAHSLGDREAVLETDLLVARIDIAAGRYETGLRDGLQAARAAREAGFESVGVSGYRNLAIMAAQIMDAASADAAIREGFQYADAIEQSHCRQMMSTTTAVLDWAAGSWEAADQRARQELVDRGCRRGVIGSLDVIGLVALGRGRVAEARRWLDESLAAGKRIGEVHFILTPLWGLAEVELASGDVAAAVDRCDEAWQIASSASERALFIPFVVTGVRSLIAARRPDDAERWVTRAKEYLAGWEPIASAALNHADGLVRMATGSMGAAREALERAVRGWDERTRTWEGLAVRLDLAQCLLRMNRYADAVSLIDAVRSRAREIGSPPIEARADELSRLTHGRGADGEAWRPLTVREFEVARLIADGLTNGEIAAELVVSPKTVSAHVEHILAKLGVSRRTEIAAWATTVRTTVTAAAGAAVGAGAAAGAPAVVGPAFVARSLDG
jgi:DNA-binding CsgD family transcriptional regulator